MFSRLKKQNAFIIVLEFAFIALIVIGITYAVFNFVHQMYLKTSELAIDTSIYGDTWIDSDSVWLEPILDETVSSDFNHVLKIDFKVRGAQENVTNDIIYDIALVNLDIDCELLSEYLKWELIKNGKVISSGNFSSSFDTIVDNRLVLTNIQQDLVSYSSDPDAYEFRLWLSDSCQSEDILTCDDSEDQSSLLNKSISGRIEVELYTGSKSELERKPSSEILSGSCVWNLDESGANKPVMDDSMIAVYYDALSSVWRKADSRNGDATYLWYDYNQQQWANAVIVDDYQKYESSAVGSEISQDDIVAFYVWIPRYRYQVWNIDGDEVKATEYLEGISVHFEFGKGNTGEITCTKESCVGNNGEWVTHPVFVQKDIKGFWIAKYLTKGSEEKPVVLEENNALVGYSYEKALSTSLKLLDYGISDLKLELLTNLEWGAVSYLAYSQYGSYFGDQEMNVYSVFGLDSNIYEMAVFDGNILGAATYEVGNGLEEYSNVVYRRNLFEIVNTNGAYGFRSVLY